MSDRPRIELPRYDGESAQAYAARVDYVTAGPKRSYNLVGEKLKKARTQIYRWASRYKWVECAEQYDNAVYSVEIATRTSVYAQSIAAHRSTALTVGDELVTMGRALAEQITSRLDIMDYKPSDLQTAVKAILYGMDLKAHALELDRVLEKSSDEDYFTT